MLKTLILSVFLCSTLIQGSSNVKEEFTSSSSKNVEKSPSSNFERGDGNINAFSWDIDYEEDWEFASSEEGSLSSYPEYDWDFVYSDQGSEYGNKGFIKTLLSRVSRDIRTPTCREKLEWFKNTTEKTDSLFREHQLKLNKLDLKPEIIDHVKATDDQFQQMIVESLKKNEDDMTKLANLLEKADQLAFCEKELEWYVMMNENLAKVAESMYKNELNNEINSDDNTLIKIYYYLSSVSKRENAFKNIDSLTKESTTPKENENSESKPTEQTVVDYDDRALDSEDDKKLKDAIGNLENDAEIRDSLSRANTRIQNNDAVEHGDAPEPEVPAPNGAIVRRS